MVACGAKNLSVLHNKMSCSRLFCFWVARRGKKEAIAPRFARFQKEAIAPDLPVSKRELSLLELPVLKRELALPDVPV